MTPCRLAYTGGIWGPSGCTAAASALWCQHGLQSPAKLLQQLWREQRLWCWLPAACCRLLWLWGGPSLLTCKTGCLSETLADVAFDVEQAMHAEDAVCIRIDMLSMCMQAPYGGQGATSGFGGGYGQGQSSKYQGGAYNQGGAYPAPQRGGRGMHAWCSILLICPADLPAARPDLPVCSQVDVWLSIVDVLFRRVSSKWI